MDDNQRTPPVKIGILMTVFVAAWVLAGIAAFIMSLVCFAFSGTTLDKLGGLAIAVMFGPFYWIYYSFMNGYCKRVTGGSKSRR